jgi:hypothetical protein
MTEMILDVPMVNEPKRRNRWTIEFSDLGFSEWTVRASSRPHMQLDTVVVPFMNSETYVAGRYRWNPITITFIDPIGPSSTQKIMEWIRSSVQSSTGKMGYASQYKKNLILKMLDPAGLTVEQWTLENCFITDAQFGTLDYSSSDLAEVQITVQMDRCILQF